ncbi:MAG: copper resistance protein CopC [Gordonia sp. (in: high G+C Gram-positive bacteria)]
MHYPGRDIRERPLRSAPKTLRLVLFVLALFGAAGASISGAGTAAAHATVVASSPADGAHLDGAATSVWFELDEPVHVVDNSANILDGQGKRISIRGVRLSDGGRRVVITPGADIADGAYLVTARVISADTHVVALSVRFTVGSVTRIGAAPAAAASLDPVPAVLTWIVKAGQYLGIVLTAGLLLASRMAWPEQIGSRRFSIIYRVSGAVLIVALLARGATLIIGQSGSVSAVSANAVATVVSGRNGLAIVVAVVATAASAMVPPRLRSQSRTQGYRILAYAAAGASITAVALAGHGGVADLWPLPLLATMIHVYAAAVWFGGVTGLAVLSPAPATLRRWHRIAVIHLLAVAASGVLLALIAVNPAAALVETVYGKILVAKVGAAGVAATLGYFTYRRLRVRIADGATGRRRNVSLLLAGEGVLAVTVICLAAVLSSVIPAKDSYTTTVEANLDFGRGQRVQVSVNTIRRGDAIITARLRPQSGLAAAEPVTVGIEMSSVQANVARLPVELTPTRQGGDRVWRSTGLIVPAIGKWKVTVTFAAGDGPRLASFGYQVR